MTRRDFGRVFSGLDYMSEIIAAVEYGRHAELSLRQLEESIEYVVTYMPAM